ncbi:hypothetical protein [Sorangium sp. So ce1024]|uniref:hypothetical protein n=1 Tax=Sorangium sp. So ce1024 TaxID=3133327 RepID=UPI003EFC9683
MDAIERMMLALSWDRGKTGPRVAKAWGLTLAAVESYSSEAARNIRRSVDPEAMRALLAKALQDGLEQAFSQGEVKAVSSLVKTYADMLGLIQSNKVQVNITVGEFGGAVGRFIAAAAPDVAGLFAAWCGAIQAGDAQAKSDPAAWVAGRRHVVEATSEDGP